MEQQPSRLSSPRRLAACAGLLAAALWLLAGLPAPALAAGALGVSPTNVLFEGRTRSAEVLLINRSDAPATYRVFFKNLRMREHGQYEDIETPAAGERFADPLIRYAPRQVRLKARGSQTVRLLLRKPPDLAPGEYRSHLHFLQLPPESAGRDIESTLGPGQISVKLIAQFGVSIPVIVRQGTLAARASLADLKIEPGAERVLALHIRREGEASVRGDLEVSFAPRGGGEPVPVAAIKGVSVLHPTPSRIARLHLHPPEGQSLGAGTLTVHYRQSEAEGGRDLAEARLTLP
jgi:P pilus assembly chaperone PapD